MNLNFNKIVRRQLDTIFALFTITLMLSSCLKEGDSFPQSGDKATEIIELGSAQTPDSYSTEYQAFSLSGEFSSDTAGFYVIVQYSGSSETAPQDINVTLTTDTAALSAYNTENSTSYVVFPDEFLTYSKTVTIAKGTDRTRIRVIVNDSTGFDFSKTYALPLKISTSNYGVISANTSTKIYAFTAKNKYDGVYSMSGYHNRSPYNYPYTDVEMYMISSGASSVKFYWVAAKSYGHPIGVSATSLSWYGATIAPEITFDPETNLITSIRNTGGSTPIDIYTGTGSGVGRYDPDTKTIYAYWRYNNNDERAFLDTLVYTGVR